MDNYDIICTKLGINGFALKWIALSTMTIDHVGMVLFPNVVWLRMIGRIAFPVYCFLLVEGALHTKDIRRYLGRLLLFAFLSEIPFNLAHDGSIWNPEYQNIYFTLFLGLLAVVCLRHQKRLLGAAGAMVMIIGAEILHTDYGGGGVVFVLVFFVFYGKRLMQSIVFSATEFFLFGGLQNYGMLALIPISLYNGKRGPSLKYFFYFYYPAHLLVLYLIRYQIG